MSTSPPSRTDVDPDADDLARASFHRNPDITDEQFREVCRQAGVHFDAAVALLRRRRSASQRLRQTAAEPPGGFLNQRYRIDPSVDVRRGGQGTVQVGEEIATGRRVAIKRLRFERPAGGAEVPDEVVVLEGVRRGTVALERNLVMYLDHGYWDAADRTASEATYTVVMPRADLTLAELLQASGPLEPASAYRLVIILARVVDGWGGKVVHRDLKPENVLLYALSPTDEEPEVAVWHHAGVRYRPVVADLGMGKTIAALAGHASTTGVERGTRDYMAPEQVKGWQLTGAVDIYALGVILARCLTGGVPFAAGGLPDEGSRRRSAESNWTLQVLREPAPTLRALADRLLQPRGKQVARPFDPRTEQVVRKCLRKGPHRRYQAGAELVADLERLLDPAKPPVAAEPLGGELDEQDRTEGDALFGGERRGRKWWRRVAGYGLLGAFVLGVAWVAESTGHRTARLAKSRLLQDASAERERAGDGGPAAVLLGLALVGSAGQDPVEEGSIRTAIALARNRLLPLRGMVELTGSVRGCAFAPDHRLVAVSTDQGEICLIDVERGERTRHDSYRTGPIKDNGNAAAGIAFNPVRPQLAVATNGGRVHLVNSVDMKLEATAEFPGRANAVHYSPDGKYLAVAGFPSPDRLKFPDATGLVVFDADTGEKIQAFPAPYDLHAVAFSPDGKRLATGGGLPPHPQLAVWDWTPGVPPGPPRVLVQPARVFALAFRPGRGAELVTGDVNGSVRFWDLSRPPGREADGSPLSHDMPVRVTAFSEDGNTLLVGGEDGTARCWDAETRHPVGQRLYHSGEVRAGAVGGGRVITTDYSGRVRVWDLRRPDAERVLGHPGPVWDAVFSPTGDRVLTGCTGTLTSDGTVVPGRARVWDLATGAMHEMVHGADVMAVRFRPGEGREAVTCGNDGRVRLWDLRAAPEPLGEPLVYAGGQVINAAAFDSAGDRLAVSGYGGKATVVQEYAFDHAGRRLIPARRMVHPTYSWVWNLHYLADGRLLADGGGGVSGWDLTGDTAGFVLNPHEGEDDGRAVEVRLGAVDDRRRTAVTVGMNGRVAVWALPEAGGQGVCSFLPDRPHGEGKLCAAVRDRDGMVATGGPDGVVRLWAADGKDLRRELHHPSIVQAVVFSPGDGRWLVTACRDGSARLWAVETGGRTGAGWFHAGPVTRVAFSPDGTRVLTASRDRTARVCPIPEPAVGEPASLLAGLEADAGVRLVEHGAGVDATYAPPTTLTRAEFLARRAAEKR